MMLFDGRALGVATSVFGPESVTQENSGGERRNCRGILRPGWLYHQLVHNLPDYSF